LVIEEMNTKYERRKVHNFERYIDELRERRRAKYGDKEREFRTISKEELIYTQTS